MKFKVQYFGVVITCFFGLVHGNAPHRMGTYDFAYEMSGDYRVKPVQVFDNGTATFFQFRAGEPIPAIFTAGSTGLVHATPEMDGPYTKVAGVARNYTLRLGYGQGIVSYAGAELPNNVAQPARTSSSGSLFAAVVQPGLQPDPRQVPRARTSMDRLLASATGGLEALPRSVFDEQPQPRIAVDVNSYAVPVKGDIAQFQPTGMSPHVSANPYSSQSPATARSASGSGSSNVYGGAPARLQETNIQFAIGSTKLGQKGLDSLRPIAKAHTPTSRYEVVGRYDASYKEDVATARANAVAAMLVSAGIPKEFISVVTTETLIPLPQAGVTTGATVSVRDAGTAVAAHAFVDTTQIQNATLAALANSLRDRRISQAQAASQIDAVRSATNARFVQPIAGFQEAQISKWHMRASDVNVHGVLQRWANDAGWQLIWKNGPDIKVSGDAEMIRDGFVSAADYLVSQARGYGHRIKAHAYNNKVMVVSAE